MSLMWESNLKGPELLMAVAIADHADTDGRCFPGLDTLAAKVKLKKRQVQEIIHRLEKRGIIKIVPGKGRGHLSVFEFQKVQDSASIPEAKRCSPPQIKGAGSCTQKVQDSASPYKEEPLIEPLMNRGKRTPGDEGLVTDTGSILKTDFDLETKTSLADSIPESLRELWLAFVRKRKLTITEKKPTPIFWKRQLGFWLTDFQRDNRFEYENLKTKRRELPSAAESIAAQEAARQNGTRADPKQFMQGVRIARQDDPKTGNGIGQCK
jgi:hypothetical protein